MKKSTTKNKNVSKFTPPLKIKHCNTKEVSPKADVLTLFPESTTLTYAAYRKLTPKQVILSKLEAIGALGMI